MGENVVIQSTVQSGAVLSAASCVCCHKHTIALGASLLSFYIAEIGS